jgi:hypothetical protein
MDSDTLAARRDWFVAKRSRRWLIRARSIRAEARARTLPESYWQFVLEYVPTSLFGGSDFGGRAITLSCCPPSPAANPAVQLE